MSFQFGESTNPSLFDLALFEPDITVISNAEISEQRSSYPQGFAIRFVSFVGNAIDPGKLSRRGIMQCCIMALVSVGLSFPVFAQQNDSYDQVWVESDASRRMTLFRGEILDYNQQRLELKTVDGNRTRTFPADQVKRIQTKYLPEHLAAHDSTDGGDHVTAFELLNQAYQKELRPWVQREILDQQIQLTTRASQHVTSAQLFAKLIQSDAQTRFFHRIPVMWETHTLNAAESSFAEQLFESKQESLALIGASWLLSGTSRSRAIAKLDELSNDIDARISHLASSQLWRIQIATATRSDLERWRVQIERMPREMRAGPLLMIGSAMARTAVQDGLVDSTVTLLLRVPILFPSYHHEAAAALFQSGRLLESAGRGREARTVYLELINDYGQTKAMEAAAQSRLVQELLNAK